MYSPRNRFARGRMRPTTGQNKTEAAYALYLESMKQQGIVLWYRFEGMKLRLADNTFYTPDFAVMMANGDLEMREVKGFWEDDARVKIKVAAEMYPFRFVAVKVIPQKRGGGWEHEVFDDAAPSADARPF